MVNHALPSWQLFPRRPEHPISPPDFAPSRHCEITARIVRGVGTVAGRPTRPLAAGPVAQWLEPAAHNGLVAGSSPAGPTNAGMHAIIFYPTAMSHIVTAKTQSITTLLAPTYGLSAQHANEPRGRRGPPAAISGRRAEERPATSRQGNLVLLRSH